MSTHAYRGLHKGGDNSTFAHTKGLSHADGRQGRRGEGVCVGGGGVGETQKGLR